ncbi:unnamed protein product [Timema podura]|uniref:RRM domain-containing protein n=1 Tax=Timema podura TaxID=61482 RepID=A0ABN7NPV5_TIMPD|nr:unnamed protein product [Timema podura]
MVPFSSDNSSVCQHLVLPFYDKRDAEDALDAMDGRMLDGRELRVQMARYGRPSSPYRRYSRRRRNYSCTRSMSEITNGVFAFVVIIIIWVVKYIRFIIPADGYIRDSQNNRSQDLAPVAALALGVALVQGLATLAQGLVVAPTRVPALAQGPALVLALRGHVQTARALGASLAPTASRGIIPSHAPSQNSLGFHQSQVQENGGWVGIDLAAGRKMEWSKEEQMKLKELYKPHQLQSKELRITRGIIVLTTWTSLIYKCWHYHRQPKAAVIAHLRANAMNR